MPEKPLPSLGVSCPTGLYLRCADCGREQVYRNPKFASYMMLVVKAESPTEGWYVAFGGPVLCPACHGRKAATVGATSFIEQRPRTHHVDHMGQVKPIPPRTTR